MRADGTEFDEVADDYDRVRETYPDTLVDAACGRARLTAGARVLEIGCGTGQLTQALAQRGLVVDAVDPGERMIERARLRAGTRGTTFHHGRFEDVELPAEAYDAVFSATAFHWVDPAVGWTKVAGLLRPGGTFALLQTGVGSPVTELVRDVVAVWGEARDRASGWTPREPFELWDGFRRRRGNLSEAWAWLTRHDLAREEAADLFDGVEALGAPTPNEYTADAFLDRTRTTSSYLRLDAAQRSRLEDGLRRAVARAGGTARFGDWAVVVTAVRR